MKQESKNESGRTQEYFKKQKRTKTLKGVKTSYWETQKPKHTHYQHRE